MKTIVWLCYWIGGTYGAASHAAKLGSRDGAAWCVAWYQRRQLAAQEAARAATERAVRS